MEKGLLVEIGEEGVLRGTNFKQMYTDYWVL